MPLFPDTPTITEQKKDSDSLSRNRHISLAEIRRTAKRKLLDLVVPAIDALERATVSGDKDDYISVKAACAILDRTGFGTHSTITIDDKVDYSKLSNDELHARLDAAKKLLPKPSPTLVTIDSDSDSRKSESPKSIH